ncbi:unnamed protein product [Calypogeia fissa]
MARPIRFSGCPDPAASRNLSQPHVVRVEHVDPGCLARCLSGGLTSTSQSAVCSNSRRWLKQDKTRLNVNHDDCSWKASAGLIWGNEDRRCQFHSSTGNDQGKKSQSRHQVTVECGSWNEAQTSSGSGSRKEAQAPSESIVTPVTLWESLKPTINYLSGAQLCMVNDALQLAFEAHDGQKRRSGEPFIIHPVAVANILGELEMDWETIVAGLLHDTVEDTEHVTFERIEQQFGSVVRRIVEGETKVSKLGKMQCQSSESKSQDVKADDLRQMFLAMTEEVRVIIVKLADRLHNMRTLGHMPPHKQQHIAQETLQVFAPLAKLLGMYRIKSELEDLSFRFSNTEDYTNLKQRVAMLCKEQEDVLMEARRVLMETIDKDQFLGFITVDVKVRTHYKELYSLYKKMRDTKCSMDEIRNIAQLRVILKLQPGATTGKLCTAQQVCYHVLGLVHAMWPPVPGMVKDYIATPKPNGYQSLHTTVIPFGSATYFPLEIQIRTEEMDKLAEWGIAAHHSGKGLWGSDPDVLGVYPGNSLSVTNEAARRGWSNNLNDAEIARRVSWLNSIREWQEEFVGNMTSREFVDTITGDLLGSRVFVFTPKGEIKNLPKGATVVDYAYQIHTDVGNKMVAAKVNGNLVSPTHTLANAEVVEVVTYDGASQRKLFELHRQWLQFARTRSARHKLTKFLKDQAQFLKDQATLSAEELTAVCVNDFVSEYSESDEDFATWTNEVKTSDEEDSYDDESDANSSSETLPSSSNLGAQEALNGRSRTEYPLNGSGSGKLEIGDPLLGPIAVVNGTAINGTSVSGIRINGTPVNGTPVNGTPVNGKHNKFLDAIFGKKAGGYINGTARISSSTASLRMTIEDEVMAKFEAWQVGRVAMWHGSGDRSVQWLSICCVDRKRMLAEVAALLGASGILICACAAETDQSRGLGIMIFHIDGDLDSLVQACTSLQKIGGVINWALGCSWQSPRTMRLFR